MNFAWESCVTEYKWRVKKSERGLSLENFIYKYLGDWSHNQVKNAINNKRAFINGRNVFVSKWNLKPNDLVLFVPGEKEVSKPGDQRYKFVDVLFEDSWLLVTNKPAFIDFETYVGTVMNYLKRKNVHKSYPYLGQMHRLDKETSGVMIFTKKKVANSLADQFRGHSLQKFYTVLVQGSVAKNEGVIKKAIEKGEFDEGKKVRISKTGKEAVTQYRVLERYADATLLEVQIKTGRTHQIRIHMSSIGHPVVGDKLYGEGGKVTAKRQILHAERLDFTHPVTNKRMKVVAPFPKDFVEIVDKLRDGGS